MHTIDIVAVDTYWIVGDGVASWAFGELLPGQCLATGQLVLEQYTDRAAWAQRVRVLGGNPDVLPEDSLPVGP